MTVKRIRDSNTMELMRKRLRPDLPRWYEVTDVGTNATHINMEDLSEEEEFWEELDYLNEDKGRLDRTKKDKRAVIQSICSRLSLGKHMRDRIVDMAVRLDGRKMNYAGGLRALAIGTIAYLVNQRRQRKPDFELKNRIENDEEFKNLAERLDVDMTDAVHAVQRAINEDRPPVRLNERNKPNP